MRTGQGGASGGQQCGQIGDYGKSNGVSSKKCSVFNHPMATEYYGVITAGSIEVFKIMSCS